MKQTQLPFTAVNWIFLIGLIAGMNSSPSILAQVDFSQGMEEMMGGMFGLTAEEREELRKVEVAIRAEKEYGENVFSGFKQQLAGQRISISDRNKDAKYLLELANRIKPLMQNGQRYPKLRIYVVDSKDVDARSIPGGILIFYRGLLEYAESEAALIGIVGHELSHLDRKHQLKPLQQQKLAQQKMQQMGNQGMFDPQDFFNFGKQAFGSFHPFHPDEEAEADLDAVRWMYQLGYQPAELGRLFRRLSTGNRPGADFIPSFLRTHPTFPERSEKVAQETNRLQQANPRADLVIGREELIKRTPAKLPQGQ